MRGPDEGRRLHHGGCRRGSDNGASEADVCGGEASAVPCLRAGYAHGGRRERGIFLGFDDQEGVGAYRLFTAPAAFLAPIGSSGAVFAAITSPGGRKYLVHVVKGGDSSVGAGLRGVTEKGNILRS